MRRSASSLRCATASASSRCTSLPGGPGRTARSSWPARSRPCTRAELPPVRPLPPGHFLTWQDRRTSITRWYDLAERTGPELDARTDREVQDEYRFLLEESVRLRFR